MGKVKIFKKNTNLFVHCDVVFKNMFTGDGASLTVDNVIKRDFYNSSIVTGNPV